MVFFCGTCWRCFPTGWKARDQHCDATGHEPPEFECDTCDRWFGDEIRRQDHMTRHRHWDPDAVECRCCTQMCADESDRSRHELRTHLYCYDCDRWFQNYNNVKQVTYLGIPPLASLLTYVASEFMETPFFRRCMPLLRPIVWHRYWAGPSSRTWCLSESATQSREAIPSGPSIRPSRNNFQEAYRIYRRCIIRSNSTSVEPGS